VYGLAILFLFALVGSLPSKWKDPDYDLTGVPAVWWWVSLVAALGATLANPFGWQIYSVVWAYSSQKAALNLVNEMHALPFRSFTDWAALIVFNLGVASLAWSRRRSVLLSAFLVLGGWCGFRVQRDVWFLAVLSVAVIAESFKDRSRPRPLSWRQTAVALAITVCIFAGEIRWGQLSSATLQKSTKQSFPVGAAEFLDSHPLPDPLFNPYDWGGYLMWRLPTRLVSIDGRAQLYGDSGLSRAFSTLAGSLDWKSDPHLQQAGTVLIDRKCALASLLRVDTEFRKVYEDDVAVLFVRETPEKRRTPK
jgi:hypothetical protein